LRTHCHPLPVVPPPPPLCHPVVQYYSTLVRFISLAVQLSILLQFLYCDLFCPFTTSVEPREEGGSSERSE
jgi:hypothetical protein